MPNQSSTSAVTIAIKKSLEDERARDMLLAIEQLFRREEQAVMFVLGCLYEIGAANAIDKKIPLTSAKPLLRQIAKLSRPAFRVLSIRWFHRNCPKLIADWLHSLVTFDPSDKHQQSQVTSPEEQVIEVNAQGYVQDGDQRLAIAVQQKQAEVMRLQHQLRQTTVFAVAIAALFGSATLWLGYELQQIRASSPLTATPTLDSKHMP